MPDERKILVAEDEPETAQSYLDVFGLKKDFRGISFLWSRTVEETREAILRDEPNVVLLDLGLGPGSPPTGLTMLQGLKGQIPAKTKILVITGYSEYQDDCLAAGCTEYLRKPLDFQKLFSLMIKYSQT